MEVSNKEVLAGYGDNLVVQKYNEAFISESKPGKYKLVNVYCSWIKRLFKCFGAMNTSMKVNQGSSVDFSHKEPKLYAKLGEIDKQVRELACARFEIPPKDRTEISWEGGMPSLIGESNRKALSKELDAALNGYMKVLEENQGTFIELSDEDDVKVDFELVGLSDVGETFD